MIGPDFADEIDCGSFFDHIDDLFVDFSGEDVDTAAAAGGVAGGGLADACSFPSIWSSQPDSVHNSDSVFSGHSASGDLSAELSVPYEDIVQLEWLSNFVEDSFSGGESLTMNQQLQQQDSSSSSLNKSSNLTPHHHQFRTSSPISVLESSSSCSGTTGEKSSGSGDPETATPGGRRGRARTKRPRPAAFNPRPAIQLISTPQPKSSSDSENFAESRPVIKIPKQVPVEKKKKKIKLTFPVALPVEGNPNGSAAVRKCMHCEITKTPQWRAGPMGPKTLCNACGVRFKSGRLFPEYRPAASPTFVPALHSNSHKKVLEMRGPGFNKSGFSGARGSASALAVAAAAPELIPNSNGMSMGYA